jgi:hypothetical protein
MIFSLLGLGWGYFCLLGFCGKRPFFTKRPVNPRYFRNQRCLFLFRTIKIAPTAVFNYILRKYTTQLKRHDWRAVLIVVFPRIDRAPLPFPMMPLLFN